MCVIEKRPITSRITLSCNTRLRAGIWICYTLEIGGFVAFLARFQTRIETIEIAAYGSFFAVLAFARYVNRGTVSMGICQ
jgi:hypothetical protein